MPSAQVFTVLTEFRFDIAEAVAESKVLQAQVGKISTAAENTLMSLQNMGKSILGTFGLLGGVSAFLYGAIQASEKFEQSQRKLANIFLSNQQAFGGQGISFAQAMRQSEKVMDNIIHKAQAFALDPGELFNQMASIAPVLVSHGLDDARLTKSTDIARGLMKSAPTLNIDPSMLGGQLTNLAMGRANMNDTLFQRLMSETKPFKDAGITNSRGFNTLEANKRIELLRQSLLQFGSNADVLRGNMMSLNGQITVFKASVYGMFSIFRSIGKAIAEPLRDVLNRVNIWLRTDGRAIADLLAGHVKRILESPKSLIVGLMQLSRLKTDVSLAASLFKIIGLVEGVTWALHFLGIELGGSLLIRGLGLLWSGLGYVARGLMFVLPYLNKFAGFLIADVLAPLALALVIFQGISNGIAKARIIDAEFLGRNMVKIAEFLSQMANALGLIFLPIRMAIDGIGDMVAWLLSTGQLSQWAVDHLYIINDAFMDLGLGVLAITGAISGIVQMAMEFTSMIANLDFSHGFERLGVAFQEGYKLMVDKYLPKENVKDDNSVSQKITNIDKIEIRNEFKEQQEPDRIAFTLKEMIMKTALNPQQAAGRSLRAGLVGG